MRKIKLAISATFLLFAINVNAQDTIQNYRHNVKIHPVIEGIMCSYEYAFSGTKNNSIKASYVFKKNDKNPLVYPMSKYKEQKFNIQFRHYFSSQWPNFKGFYHAANLQYKRFEGTSAHISSDFIFPINPIPIKYNNNTLSLGYAFGYQVMSQSRFTLDVGYIVSKQFLVGQSFKTFIFDEIPFRPYVNGINSQFLIEMGIAF